MKNLKVQLFRNFLFILVLYDDLLAAPMAAPMAATKSKQIAYTECATITKIAASHKSVM